MAAKRPIRVADAVAGKSGILRILKIWVNYDPDPPCMECIYLHLGHRHGVHVGKYSLHGASG